jgi:hypothetical protein
MHEVDHNLSYQISKLYSFDYIRGSQPTSIPTLFLATRRPWSLYKWGLFIDISRQFIKDAKQTGSHIRPTQLLSLTNFYLLVLLTNRLKLQYLSHAVTVSSRRIID